MTMTNAGIDIGAYNTAALDRIRDHRFIKAAHAHQLTADQIYRWIFCAGRESRSFPGILERMLLNTENEQVRLILQDNLNDEYGNGKPEHAHFLHYLHLLDKLGVGVEPFDSYEELSGIGLALELATWVSRQPDLGIAIGYMLVNEGMTPITYGAVDVALHTFHPALETEFFRLHVEIDAIHVEQLRTAAAHLGIDAAPSIRFGIDLGERGMAVLLDEAYGVFLPDATESIGTRAIH